MANYSAGPMSAFAWPQASGNSRTQKFSITVEWTWPSQGFWSRFRLVRSARSPCVRVEEGTTVLDTVLEGYASYNVETGRPNFRDGEREDQSQPPLGEWVFYTAFVLDGNRIWKPAGSAAEISPLDTGWSARLPELLPGASTAVDRGMMHPPDRLSDVVQFLQGPAAFLDMLVSKAEAAQFFWDPRMCPPQALPHLSGSWGYPLSNLLGTGRSRQALAALREPSQGSVAAITRIVEAATGGDAFVEVSNNLMLSINDSSFECDDISDTRWAPQEGLTIGNYEDLVIPAKVPPNVQVSHFLSVRDPGTYMCGADDPVLHGIPVQDWDHVRMGCYAVDVQESGTDLDADLVLGLDVYDRYGVFLQRFETVSTGVLGASWEAYGLSDPDDPEDFGNRVPLIIGSQESAPEEALTEESMWVSPPASGYASQTQVPTVVPEGIVLSWDESPAEDGSAAFWGLDPQNFAVPIVLGAQYLVEARVLADTGDASWRIAVQSGAGGVVVVPSTDDSGGGISSFLWMADTDSPLFGVEVKKPSGGWAGAGTHLVTSISVVRQNAEAVYGVPWFTASNPCYVDLIVVDDGR